MKSQPHVAPGQTPQRSTDALETSAAAACAAIQTMRSSGGSGHRARSRPSRWPALASPQCGARLSEAPQALREAGLAAALGATDVGDVTPEPYRDFVRPSVGARNQQEVQRTDALAARVASTLATGAFPIVLGGDCSVVLGCLLGARRAGSRPIGLAYLDAHADFGTLEESRTGSAASMCLHWQRAIRRASRFKSR